MARKAYKRVSQREYARYLNISNEAVSRAVKDGRIKKGWDAKTGKIIVEHADKEFGLLHRKVSVNTSLPGEDEPEANSGSLQLSGGSSYGEAKRVREIIQAQLVALDLKERKGELVKKDDVHKELFVFGQQLRVSIMSVPDRVIDNVLASKSRAEAYNILSGAIHEALEGLTTRQLDFSPKK